jgi:transposase
MPFTPYAPSPHREEAKAALREGASIDEIVRRFGVSESTAKRYRKQIKEEKGGTPPNAAEPAKAMVTGGELGTIVQPKAGTVIFTFGQEIIPLNYFLLYDAYQYYKDIQREHQIEDDFCTVIKDSVKYVWERLNQLSKSSHKTA